MNVTENPETNDQLLLRIRDPEDRDAWYEFMLIYRPLIYRVGRRHGLQDADAQNLVQEVLHKVGQKVAGWEPGKPQGSFRRWLATIARNAAIDAIRRVKPDSGRGGTSIQNHLQQIEQRDSDSDEEFRHEIEREAFRWAARRIRDEFADATWTAFWETMVEGVDCAVVAQQLGKSVGAIYTSRSRVMQRLKKEVETFCWKDSRSRRNSGQ